MVFRLPSCRCNEVRWRNQDPAFVGARRIIQVREREGAFTFSMGKKAKCPMRVHRVFSSGGVLMTRGFPRARPLFLRARPSTPRTRQHGVFSVRVGASESKKPSTLARGWVSSSGDVLLSHGLSPYYHRGCSVSLPCSEWERVVPLRYCHQSAEPHWRFAAVGSDASAKPGLWRLGTIQVNHSTQFGKNTIFNQQSQIQNLF